LKWLNIEAEESIRHFEVLSTDVRVILEQQEACDELHRVTEVMCSELSWFNY